MIWCALLCETMGRIIGWCAHLMNLPCTTASNSYSAWRFPKLPQRKHRNLNGTHQLLVLDVNSENKPNCYSGIGTGQSDSSLDLVPGTGLEAKF